MITEEQLKELQNRIAGLVVDLDSLKKSHGDKTEINAVRSELAELKKEYEALKKVERGPTPKTITKVEPSEEDDSGYGYWSL